MNPLQQLHLKMSAVDAITKALISESALRKGRAFEEWMKAEAEAVWRAARDFAGQHGLRTPLLEEVIRAERAACGHSDYASKWGLYVAEIMLAPERCAV